jgi:hypothetical protein
MSEAKAEKLDELTQAVQAAQTLLLLAFKDEHIENLGLEEVQQSPASGTWEVTLGFNRRRERPEPPNSFLQMAAAAVAARPTRGYKVVKVDLTGVNAISIAATHTLPRISLRANQSMPCSELPTPRYSASSNATPTC